MGLYEITLGKEDMKFSSAHFTLFDGAMERLHGHNYHVLLTVKALRLRRGLLLDFGILKQEARRLCAELDEALLVPGDCPELELLRAGDEIELRLRGKRYVLPAEDCRVLPVPNMSCECLAAYFCHSLMARLETPLRAAGVLSLAATVEESPGQSGRCEEALGASGGSGP
jgi:6-pyruvoyltetrahydropterin/6-carboxytetrahydropterin synthase